MKSVTYFFASNSSRLTVVLAKSFDVQLFDKDPLAKGIDIYLPPGRMCVVDDSFSASGGVRYLKRLKEKYPGIVSVLCVEGEIHNETVAEAVSIGSVYRIFSLEWSDENILSVMNDAFAYSKETRKNLFLLREEQERHQRLISTQQALKNEEFLNVESLMYADQIVQYAKSSIDSYNQILSAIGSGRKSKELLDSIREKINRLVPVDAISLCFRSKRISSRERLNISFSFTGDERDVQQLSDLSEKFYEKVFQRLQPNSRNKVSRFLKKNHGSSSVGEIVNDFVVSSSLIIPLIHQEKYMGNLVLFRFERPCFKRRELLIVEHFAEAGNIVARGFRNFEYYEKTKKEWESTFDAISDPVSIVDLDYNLIRVNRAYVQTSRFTIDAVVGEKCYEVLAGSKVPCKDCPLKCSVTEREVKTCDELKVDSRVYNVWAYPLETADRDIKSVVLFYRDITGEKFLTQQLMQADKLAEIGILAGSVAHEINNPLGGILAFSQIILRELGSEGHGNKQFREDMKEIEDAALRGKKIVEGLLNFSRMSRAEDFKEVNIPDVIRTALSLVEYNARLCNVDLKTSFDENLPCVAGDYNQLLQVFLTLLAGGLNSITMTEQKNRGVIDITVRYDSEMAEVIVELVDSGRSISAERVPRIFNPNVLLHEEGNKFADTGFEKRAGPGLSVSYGIIQDHNGSISISPGKDRGNKYTICLPVCPDEGQRPLRQLFRVPGG